MVSLLSLLSRFTLDLDVAGFLVSGVRAVSRVSASFFEGSSMWIVAVLLISAASRLGGCLSWGRFYFNCVVYLGVVNAAVV